MSHQYLCLHIPLMVELKGTKCCEKTPSRKILNTRCLTLSISPRMTLLMSFLVPKDSVFRNSVKILESHYTKLGGLQPLFLRTRKKKRVGFASEESRKNFLFISVRTPTPPILPFCAGVQFPSDSVRAFNHRIKIRENKGL